MRTEGNVGRRLAEALYRLGNQVIISGRRKGHLAKTLEANPGMDSIELDVTAPGSILRAAREQISNYPTLNVLINDPGIMLIDDASAAVDDELVTSTIATNLMGPIRITGALIHGDDCRLFIDQGRASLLCSVPPTDAHTIMVPAAKFLRDQAGPNEAAFVSSFNEQLEAPQPSAV
jgi:NAD(P)-dependent dehydrogenase (short-subunit alcohol dehydrogenase family)